MKGSIKSRGFFFLVTLIVSFWGWWFFLAPQAQGDPKGVKGSENAGRDGPKKSKSDLPSKRLRMEEVEIHGEVEKPKTMFVIPRASLRFSRKAHEKDFTGEILDPTMKHWVEDTQRWREAVPPP